MKPTKETKEFIFSQAKNLLPEALGFLYKVIPSVYPHIIPILSVAHKQYFMNKPETYNQIADNVWQASLEYLIKIKGFERNIAKKMIRDQLSKDLDESNWDTHYFNIFIPRWAIMIKCPFCAEDIHYEAIKCKHCTEWLKKPTNIGWRMRNGILLCSICSLLLFAIIITIIIITKVILK